MYSHAVPPSKPLHESTVNNNNLATVDSLEYFTVPKYRLSVFLL